MTTQFVDRETARLCSSFSSDNTISQKYKIEFAPILPGSIIGIIYDNIGRLATFEDIYDTRHEHLSKLLIHVYADRHDAACVPASGELNLRTSELYLKHDTKWKWQIPPEIYVVVSYEYIQINNDIQHSKLPWQKEGF